MVLGVPGHPVQADEVSGVIVRVGDKLTKTQSFPAFRYLGTAGGAPGGEASDASTAVAVPAAAPGSEGTTHVRSTDPLFAEGYETRFSDGYPCLLANQVRLQSSLGAGWAWLEWLLLSMRVYMGLLRGAGL